MDKAKRIQTLQGMVTPLLQEAQELGAVAYLLRTHPESCTNKQRKIGADKYEQAAQECRDRATAITEVLDCMQQTTAPAMVTVEELTTAMIEAAHELCQTHPIGRFTVRDIETYASVVLKKLEAHHGTSTPTPATVTVEELRSKADEVAAAIRNQHNHWTPKEQAGGVDGIRLLLREFGIHWQEAPHGN